MSGLLDRQLLVVTGKGGTGKTTVAVALARLAAEHGKRVLLCDVDATGDVGVAFAVEDYGYEPLEVATGLYLMQMDTEQALREYLADNLKLPFVAKVTTLARAFDFIATAAPGVREILVMGKLAWEVKRKNYDLVVVDASATGHVISQLSSADAIGDLVSSGPLTGQTAWMKEMLGDAERTGVVIVTTPEELPVSESIELREKLAQKTRVHLAAVAVNRVLPELFTRDETARLAELDDDHWQERISGNKTGVLEVTRFAVARRRTQVAHLATLQGAMADLDLVFVPQMFGPSGAGAIGTEVLAALRDVLS